VNSSTDPGALRRQFLVLLLHGLRVVWPILALLLVVMVSLGIAVAWLEKWPLVDGIYFAFVSGLTIGYGDLAPKGGLARVLAISIGFTGILLGGLVAAVGVHALQSIAQAQRRP
jgi:Ion channel